MKTDELSMVELLPNFLDPIDGKIARIDNLFFETGKFERFISY